MPLRPIWEEISKKEYNKYAFKLPDDYTLEQKIDYIFTYNPKFTVKCEVVIPDGMGILGQAVYINSDEPKSYKYFKKVGDEFFFYVSNITLTITN